MSRGSQPSHFGSHFVAPGSPDLVDLAEGLVVLVEDGERGVHPALPPPLNHVPDEVGALGLGAELQDALPRNPPPRVA